MFSRTLVASAALALVLAGCASPALHVPASAPASASSHAPVEINLVAINDFHGNLEPNRYVLKHGKADAGIEMKAGGIATLGGALNAWRREDKDLLFVAAGDLVGASPALSSMWADEPSIEAMNRMGLVASSLGNHEFDPGPKELLRQQNGGCDSPRPTKACQLDKDFKGARFAYLGANVVDEHTGRTLVAPWRIVEVKGVKVGLVGALLHDLASVTVASSIRNLDVQDEATTINRSVAEMRAAGAKVFIVLIHEGGHTDEAFDKTDCTDLKGPIVDITRHLDPAIRLVISGHSHTGYLCKVDGRVVTQADAMGHLLSRIRMTVDPVSGRVEDINVRNVVMDPAAFTPDARLASYLADVRARSDAQLAKPVGKIAVATLARKENEDGESALGDLIADAAVAATQAQGAQIGFMNPGGIRRDLDSGADGVVSYGQAQAVLPFGNTLVVQDLTGAQLRAVLEQQWDRPGDGKYMLQVSRGLSYRWDSTQPKGARLVPGSVRVNGAPLSDTKVYRVVANNFLADGGDNFPALGKGANKVDTGVRDLDALIAYMKQHPEPGSPSLAPQARIQKVR
jgi:5'-nucleotidase